MATKKVAVFRASPRSKGNTNALADVVVQRLRESGAAAGNAAEDAAEHMEEHAAGPMDPSAGTDRTEIRISEFNLYNMDIRPCTACRYCQRDQERVICARRDDMARIFEAVQESDLLILVTPVYSWYCTPPMKAMLDRLVYAMNKYYGSDRGSGRGPSLWKGRKVALITSCGYPPEKGADLLQEGIRRYCVHSQLQYEGMLCGRHMGYGIPFMDEEKQRLAGAFADKLIASLDGE